MKTYKIFLSFFYLFFFTSLLATHSVLDLNSRCISLVSQLAIVQVGGVPDKVGVLSLVDGLGPWDLLHPCNSSFLFECHRTPLQVLYLRINQL